MFSEETVFILGAGASKCYGYPLGSELIENIIDAIEKESVDLPFLRGEERERQFQRELTAENLDLEDFSKELETCSDIQLVNTPNPFSDALKIRNNHEGKFFCQVRLSSIKQFKELRNKLRDFFTTFNRCFPKR